MFIKLPMFFSEEFEGGGGAGNASEYFEPVSQGGDSQQTQSEPEIKEEPRPNTGLVDVDALATKFGEQIAKHTQTQKQQAAPEQKQLSPEEVKKLLKVWEPSDDYFVKFNNLETQKAAFLEMRDALMDQFNAISEARGYQMQQEWNNKFQPVQQYLSKQDTDARISRFHSKYPSLSAPELSDFVVTVGSKLAQAGAYNGKSEEECFNLLANQVEGVMKKIKPDFSVNNNSSQNQNQGRSSNSISPAPQNGMGGGGGNGSSRPTGPVASRILGDPGKK